MSSKPVVLVGLPRSGSTLCTAMLNEAPELYVLNDAYILQEVDATGSWGGFKKPEHAQAMLDQITAMVKQRSAVVNKKTITNSSRMSAEALEQVLTEIAPGKVPTDGWPVLMEHAMSTAARGAGKTRWGWNTPQDLYHINKIKKAFPDALFLFMMRDPFAVLRSFKFRPREEALRRYHPLAQASAWRRAIKAYDTAKEKYPESVLMVRYEDIVKDTRNQIVRMNAFLETSIPEDLQLDSLGSNSSYRFTTPEGADPAPEKSVPKPLGEVSGFEQWAADRIVYDARRSVGYDSDLRKLSLSGFGGFTKQSMVFAQHYGMGFLTDKNTRKRVLRFIQN